MDNNIPFYLQIKNFLKQKILMNELNPGDLIPSERELTERFKMSRSTIRKAINELVYEGCLIKVQGKGTFVAKHNLEKDLYNITAFKTNKAQETETGYENMNEGIIDVAETDLPNPIKEKFQNKLYYLKRVILVDEERVGIQKIWSYPEYVNEIGSKAVDQLETIGKEFYEEISISYPENEESSILEVKRKTPLLKVTQLISKDKPIIYVLNLFDSKKIKLTKKTALNKGGVSQIR